MSVTNVLMAGVGGQGVLVASQALAFVAVAKGFDVKKSDVHGMAQRGGSVISHVRFGEKVYSPLIPDGEADILLATERLEALRYLPFVKKGGRLVVNIQKIPPPTVTSGVELYPEDILERLKEFDPKMIGLDCLQIAKEIGEPRTSTVVLLGAFSLMLPFEEELWLDGVKSAVPKKAGDINIKAFKKGKEIGIKRLESC